MTDRTEHDVWVLMLWAVGMAWFCLFVFGCVRTVTVCTTYDRRLGHESASTPYARQSAGASVCAEVSPPGAAED